jgi:hypothetical protein
VGFKVMEKFLGGWKFGGGTCYLPFFFQPFVFLPDRPSRNFWEGANSGVVLVRGDNSRLVDLVISLFYLGGFSLGLGFRYLFVGIILVNPIWGYLCFVWVGLV